jgi:hypothetical protein
VVRVAQIKQGGVQIVHAPPPVAGLDCGQFGKLRAGCFTGASGGSQPPQVSNLPRNPVHTAFPQNFAQIRRWREDPTRLNDR